MMHPKTDAEYIAKIRSKVLVTPSGCWEFQGFCFKPPKSYGMMSYRGQKWRVHRLMYALAVGPLEADKDVCHSCDNPKCCNPEHLWLGTRKENLRDSMEKRRHWRHKNPTCHRGHEWTPENTWVDRDNRRHCKACHRLRLRKKAGWSDELAANLPPTSPGFQPVGGKWHFQNKS